MSAAELRRLADLCCKAAKECACPVMRKIWYTHSINLTTEALRAERYDRYFREVWPPRMTIQEWVNSHRKVPS